MSKGTLGALIRLSDCERGGEERVGVYFLVTRPQKELLERTARQAGLTRTGTLKLGLQLAAQAVGVLISEDG